MDLFIASGYSNDFGKDKLKYASGLSGTEPVMEIIKKSGKQLSFLNPQLRISPKKYIVKSS